VHKRAHAVPCGSVHKRAHAVPCGSVHKRAHAVPCGSVHKRAHAVPCACLAGKFVLPKAQGVKVLIIVCVLCARSGVFFVQSAFFFPTQIQFNDLK